MNRRPQPRTRARSAQPPQRHATRRGHAPARATRAVANAPGRRLSPVVFVAAFVALVAFVGIAASTCSSQNDAQRTTPYASAYDWSNLVWNGDRLAYVQNGSTVSRLGVDVSDHQGFIDWNAVAGDGIEFAIVRVGNRGYTEGALSADAYFDYNIDGAQAAGLDAGVYFFSQATSVEEAREEAEFVLDRLAGRSLQLPVVFDHEPITSGAIGRANDVAGETLTACMEAFCSVIEAAGYDTMVYGNQSDMARFSGIDGSAEAAAALNDALGGRALWFAEYGVSQPSAAFDFSMWQYTNSGSVAGIDTAVDLNILLP